MSDIFVDDEHEEQNEVKSRKPVQKDKIPSSHIPIKLSSAGKLSMPKVIHIRNYSGQDALDLAQSSNDVIIEAILKVIDGMIWEDVDVSLLHQKELEEIMLNVYLNWWGTYIKDYPYPWEEEEIDAGIDKGVINEQKAENIRKGKDDVTINIPIVNIDTENLPAEFKEPIKIINDKNEYVFRLPRVGDIVTTEKFIEEKYFEEDNKFSSLKNDIDYNIANKNNPNVQQRKIDPKVYKEYLTYRGQRNKDFLALQNMLLFLRINDTKFEDNEQRLKYYSELPLHIVGKLEKIVEDVHFGPEEEMKVISPITKEEVTRRFQFRALDYVPSMEAENDDGYTVVFGEQ